MKLRSAIGIAVAGLVACISACDPLTVAEADDNVGASQPRTWVYRSTFDAMTGGTVRTAEIRSATSGGRLTIRDHPTFGNDVIFSISAGQIVCVVGCKIRIRFDDRTAEMWSAAPSSDFSMKTIFVSGFTKFIERIRSAQVVRIQPTLYQQGSPVFEFHVAEFDMDRFQSGGE